MKKRGHRIGLFVTFEGPEGSGKSTQLHHLDAALRKAGYSVTATREPGGTKVAEAIRKTLLSSAGEKITPQTEALLVLAARNQHVAHLIQPALDRGTIVLCDRFADSTFAYQGFGRGLPLSWLRTVNRAATGGLAPHLTLLLDLPPSIGLTRRGRARGILNRLDRESMKFHLRVRQGFLTLASRAPQRIKVIDAARPAEVVRAEIEALVLGWLRTKERRAGAG
ncbi:MAG TPA: dTMP kinase [Nitrospira sp.]|nr:dTMP kinase [Nitrospira sp.]